MTRAEIDQIKRAIALSRDAGHDKVPVSIAVLRRLLSKVMK